MKTKRIIAVVALLVVLLAGCLIKSDMNHVNQGEHTRDNLNFKRADNGIRNINE